MQLDLSEDQLLMRGTLTRLLDTQSAMARVRATLPSGFDAGLWRSLAQFGAFGLRVPAEAGGLGLGLPRSRG